MTKSNKLTISGRAVSCFEYEKSADYIKGVLVIIIKKMQVLFLQ